MGQSSGSGPRKSLPPWPPAPPAACSRARLLSPHSALKDATQGTFRGTVNVSIHILSLCSVFHDNKVRRQRLSEQLLPKLEIPGIEHHLSIRSQMYRRAIYQPPAHSCVPTGLLPSRRGTMRASSSLCVTQNG